MHLIIFLAVAFVVAFAAARVLLYLTDDASQLQYPESCPVPDRGRDWVDDFYEQAEMGMGEG